MMNMGIKMILQLGSFMGAVDDPAIVFGIDVGLGSQLEAEVLDDIAWRTGQLVGDVAKVHDDRLDAVAFALDLGLEALHLVAVEGVRDITANVDVLSHGCGIGDAVGGCLDGGTWLRTCSSSSSRGRVCQRHTVDTRCVCQCASGEDSLWVRLLMRTRFC